MKILLPDNIVRLMREFRRIAFAIWIGMIVYLVSISLHYLFNFDDLLVHDIGIVFGSLATVFVIVIMAKRYGWIEALEKMED